MTANRDPLAIIERVCKMGDGALGDGGDPRGPRPCGGRARGCQSRYRKPVRLADGRLRVFRGCPTPRHRLISPNTGTLPLKRSATPFRRIAASVPNWPDMRPIRMFYRKAGRFAATLLSLVPVVVTHDLRKGGAQRTGTFLVLLPSRCLRRGPGRVHRPNPDRRGPAGTSGPGGLDAGRPLRPLENHPWRRR